MKFYSSDYNAATTSLVSLLSASSSNIAVVHPCCNQVFVVCKSAIARAIDIDFRLLLKPEHPEYFFLSLKFPSNHGPVTPASQPCTIWGIFYQCVGQLLCVPPCCECRGTLQAPVNNNSLFFNLYVTFCHYDGRVHCCGSCANSDRTCTPSKFDFSKLFL